MFRKRFRPGPWACTLLTAASIGGSLFTLNWLLSPTGLAQWRLEHADPTVMVTRNYDVEDFAGTASVDESTPAIRATNPAARRARFALIHILQFGGDSDRWQNLGGPGRAVLHSGTVTITHVPDTVLGIRYGLIEIRLQEVWFDAYFEPLVPH